MPVPIKLVHDDSHNDSGGCGNIDYSFLANFDPSMPDKKIMVTATNKDAELLYNLWACSEKTEDEKYTFRVDDAVDQKDIIRLKSRGLLTGGIDKVTLTRRGKAIIKTMALSEPSRFDQKRKSKSYNEILAEQSKKGKPGYRIPKYATNNNNCLRLK